MERWVATTVLLLASHALVPLPVRGGLCHVVADAGGPYRAECSGDPAVVLLDGSRSAQCPGVDPHYLWTTTCPGGRFDDPTSLTPSLHIDAGAGCPIVCEVALLAEDDFGGRDRDTAPVLVEDTIPPRGAGPEAILAELWPPDHRWRCFQAAELVLAGAVEDDCDPEPFVRLVDCRSTEDDNVPGDGNSAPDCAISASGSRLCARAERAGPGAGRSYLIHAEAVDRCGNASGPVPAGRLIVPHDRRR